MSVAAFYEGKARGETDEKYRVLGLAQLADFHAASSVPEGVERYLCRRAKRSPKRQNGRFSSRFLRGLPIPLGWRAGTTREPPVLPFLDTTPSGTYAEHPRKNSRSEGWIRRSDFKFRISSFFAGSVCTSGGGPGLQNQWGA